MLNILTSLTCFVFTVLFKVVKYFFQKSVIRTNVFVSSMSHDCSLVKQKLNSTTDDEASSSTSISKSTSSNATSNYFSQMDALNHAHSDIDSDLNESSTPSSILPVTTTSLVAHEEEEEERVENTSEDTSNSSQATSHDASDHAFEISQSDELRKDLSLQIEDLYDRLQVVNATSDLSNEYIQNIIRTSLIKYSIKKSVNAAHFKYYNDEVRIRHLLQLQIAKKNCVYVCVCECLNEF